MYKTSQEFTFTINQDDTDFNFTGQLVFEGKEINDIGTLHTEEELSSFGTILNESLRVPEYWTLETLAKYLYDYARPVFKNLHAVTLYLTAHPQRVTEYRNDTVVEDYYNGDILELENIV